MTAARQSVFFGPRFLKRGTAGTANGIRPFLDADGLKRLCDALVGEALHPIHALAFDTSCGAGHTLSRFAGQRGEKGSAKGGQFAEDGVYRRYQARDRSAARIINRAGDVLDAKPHRFD